VIEVLVKGGTDRGDVVALLAIEQALSDQRIDLTIADFDHQTTQAVTPAFAMQTPPVCGRFPDRVNLNLCHWTPAAMATSREV
jgi:hypothetical protein